MHLVDAGKVVTQRLQYSTLALGFLLAPLQGDARIISSSDAPADELNVWDVRAGRLIGVPQALPPALTYRWTDDGHLAADTPLPSICGGSEYTGSPTRRPDAVISRWQPGALSPLPPLDAQGALDEEHAPAGWFMNAASTLWSPDGRYLATLSFKTRLVTPGAAGSIDPRICQLVGAPPRRLHPIACGAT